METLEGKIIRITYRNHENGYTVLKIIPSSGPGAEITVVGILPGLEIGDEVKFDGAWTSHKKFGRQFSAESYQLTLPSTPEGLKAYLASHVKGIGPVLAQKIITAFADQTTAILEHHPEKLAKIRGITKTKAEEIGRAWQKDRAIRDQLMKLSQLGISPKLSLKIINTYENRAYETIKENPYRLAEDIGGVGFIKADEIASALGFTGSHPQRIAAGVKYVLTKALEEGHLFLPESTLVARTAELISIPAELSAETVAKLVKDGELVKDKDESVYLSRYHEAETDLAEMILKHQRLSQKEKPAAPADLEKIDFPKAFAWVEERQGFPLHPDQKKAIQTALTHPLTVLTGGPGTGKSTTLKALVLILLAKQKKVALCAPTGRAAKRLTEITDFDAKTIHRTLKIDRTGRAHYNRSRFLPVDFLIVDEASMLDVLLAQKLLAAVGPKTYLLIVGDDSQLPSVQAGNVLGDVIASGVIPTVKLTHIFRQAQESAIVRNAHRINGGYFPELPQHPTDFYFFDEPDAAAAADLIVKLVTRRIPREFNVDPMTDVQVLAPMHKGACGVEVLNQRLQETLNPPSPALAETPYGNRVFRVNDRVLQTSNNYEKEVFNGEVGKIARISREDGELKVSVAMNGRLISYTADELDQLTHAFAMSIHKSQGSEFNVVVLPILTSHYIMLARNLLYTAVTRAKKLVVLVGSKQAIGMAVNNDKAQKRYTLLAARLRGDSGYRLRLKNGQYLAPNPV
jgi:exodeoxyribonuclease V alpha subunit